MSELPRLKRLRAVSYLQKNLDPNPSLLHPLTAKLTLEAQEVCISSVETGKPKCLLHQHKN